MKSILRKTGIRKELETKKIKRSDLEKMDNYTDYIKSSSDLVSDVFPDSLFFGKGTENIFGWDEIEAAKNKDIQDMILRGINAMFNTRFEFKEEA